MTSLRPPSAFDELLYAGIVTDIIGAYDWLVCYMLRASAECLEANSKKYDSFTAKNESQAYYARTLSVAFVERFVFIKFLEKSTADGLDPSLRDVLLKLCSLFGTWSLEKHLANLYQGAQACNFIS